MSRLHGTFTMVVLLVAPALGCAPPENNSNGNKIGDSNNAPLQVYQNPYAMEPTKPNPIQVPGASATATAYNLGGGLRVILNVSGMPPNRGFGAHLHALPCEMNKAGGHYQNNVAPMGMATNVAYANTDNEVWLDFMTDATGRASRQADVRWLPRQGGANAIIIHDYVTIPQTSAAGDKLACLPMTF